MNPGTALSSQEVAAAAKRLAEPRLVAGGACWLEGRPAEGGLVTLIGRWGNHTKRLVPPGFSVRSRLHEYGGGAYCATASGFYFVNDLDGEIYFVTEATAPRRVSRAEGLRFGDLHWGAAPSLLFAVAESERNEADQLVAIDDQGNIRRLFQGPEFLSSPAFDPVSGALAWLSWSRPDMPWTETALMRGTVRDGRLEDIRTLAQPSVSFFQPQWSPSGELYCVADIGGWWNIHRLRDGSLQPVTELQAEIGLPQWVAGMSVYGFLSNDELLAAKTESGTWTLLRIDIATGAVRDVCPPGISHIEHLAANDAGAVMLAGGWREPTAAWRVSGDGEVERLSEVEPVPEVDRAEPAAIQFETAQGQLAHGFFYRPAEPVSPPLLVTCHGGPTAAASTALDLKMLFWLSRGFAVLDVNYRGSTGFGRGYRESLYGQWGAADVEDCVNGALHLARLGQVDSRALLIRGGSAGGLTVLNALASYDVFAAGTSYYGVTDLASLFATTARFEAGYDHWLLGDDAQAAARARSPMNRVANITAPVLIFQGEQDLVVPPDQARSLYEALRHQGTPVAYRSFPEEGHGFRSASTIAECLDRELEFYALVRGLRAGAAVPADIDNWP